MRPATCVQMDENKQWAVALSTVQPIAQMQSLSWSHRVAERVQHISSSLYRCAALHAAFQAIRVMGPVVSVPGMRYNLLCNCRRAGEALSRPFTVAQNLSSGTAQPCRPEPSTAPEVAAEYAEPWKPVDAPPQACIQEPTACLLLVPPMGYRCESGLGNGSLHARHKVSAVLQPCFRRGTDNGHFAG